MISVVLFFILVFSLPSSAGDSITEAREIPTEGVAALFNVVARPPKPGDWMEYRIAFPVDPLENSLSPSPAPLPMAEDHAEQLEHVAEVGGEFYIKPSFEPPSAWRVLPLRLEVTMVDSLGLEAILRFEKETRIVHLPIDNDRPKSEFFYDPPQPEESQEQITLDSGTYNAVKTTRIEENYGFVRIAGTDAPFGLFRFATENVDLILVGMGNGMGPVFPLRVESPIVPAPGRLYRPVP